MRITPLAAGCIAAVLGGTAAVLFAAWRTQQEIAAQDVALRAGFDAAASMTEADLTRLAAQWARELERVGTVKIRLAAQEEGRRTVEEDFGITPAFRRDIAAVYAQGLATYRDPWNAVLARLL
jgi:hypothetical protein